MAQGGIDVEALVGQQAVHLLDGMLGDQAAGQRQSLTDGMDRQGRCLDDAEGGVGQGQHTLGMQIAVEQTVQETVHILEAKGLVEFHR